MLIIKPYGKSVVKAAPTGEKAKNCRRKIRTSEKKSGQDKTVERAVADFVTSRDEAVIAQWVSAIDKIIAKPGEKAADNKAKDLRKILGNAAWAVIKGKNLLQKLAGTSAEKQEIEKIWQWKMAATQPKAPRTIKGRWYEAFAGNIACDKQHIEAKAGEIADKIYHHLYSQAYRFPLKSEFAQSGATSDSRRHQKGLIEHRASSIAKDIPHIRDIQETAACNESDKEKYIKTVGNIAAAIKQAILAPEKSSQTGYKDQPYEIAARIMRETGDRLFAGLGDFKTVKAQKPGLLALHSQIKAGYKALLKGRKQLKTRLEYLLPEDNEALFHLVAAQQQNRHINHLIRLGKIVHYTAISVDTASLAALPSSPKTIINNWPQKEAVEESRFWSSAGQTEIKQNEAFVRVWRGALAFAARTLKDWVDPQDKIPRDILLDQKGALDNFDAGYFEQKYQILFGDKWKTGEDKDECEQKEKEYKRALLEFFLSSLYALRNAAFHFSNLALFVNALTPKEVPEPEEAPKSEETETPPQAKLNKFLAKFYTDACHNYRLRQLAIMQGARFHDFLSEAEIETIWRALTSAQASPLPVPRLERVLERATDAWKGKDRLQVPPYSTAEEREASAWARCQYTAAKLLYDGPFKNWLEGLGQAELSGYINRALEHTSQAAQNIKSGDKEFEEFIASKAGKIAELGAEKEFSDFFSTLTAATATEMRVQNFYQSDGKAAKKQAAYIEKFKCDVVALAFAGYLCEILGSDNIKQERKEKPGSSRIYDRLPVSVEQNSAGAPWQSRLYFLLHLMPVEEAGSLRQQLKKWEIITDKSHGEQGRGGDILTRLLAVFDLYIAMHDAQFVGAELASLESDKKTAQALFENKGDFKKVFPEKKDGVEDEHLPIRGLREMQRFGTGLLHNFYENHKITGTSVTRWQELEKIIAQEQRKLKHLHRDWVKSKNRKNNIKWGAEEETAYKSALKLVTEHRHLTARVMLQSHVRLHRLLIKILGRLVDFAGLWERDLYFVLLARLHLKGVKTEDIAEQFKDKGAKLENGQIVVALRELKDTGLQAKVADLLNQKETKEIRNGFDHFDTLKVKYFPVNLTAEIDKARRLMAYDRKLKNAVTKSVIDLLKRETIELKWSMGADHKLEKVSFISSAKAFHLDKESGNNKIVEELCDSHFIAMAKSLFTGE